MSFINDDDGHQYIPREWIKNNHPENGLFRVYWKNVVNWEEGGATFDPDEGEGLRWEWYYKDGERADGISRGWYPNGNLKSEQLNGLWIENVEAGMKGIELNMKNGKKDGLFTIFYMQNGQKREEQTWKDGKPDGLRTFWYENGQKKWEETYKDGLWDGLRTYYNEDGSIKELKHEIKETTPRSWYDPYYRAKNKLRIGGNNE